MTDISVCEPSPHVGAASPGKVMPAEILPIGILLVTADRPKCRQAQH